VKEALFSVVESILMKRGEEKGNLWEGLVVLDLYAGTGALGIESLSRGAAWVDFVDSSRICCQAIQENLAKLELKERGRVHCWRIRGSITEGFARRLNRSYDIIFADPPYKDTNLVRLAENIVLSTLAKGDGILIVEHGRDTIIETPPSTTSRRWSRETRTYGDTALSIFQFYSAS